MSDHDLDLRSTDSMELAVARFGLDLGQPLAKFGIVPIEDALEGEHTTAELRRRGRSRIEDSISRMTLVDADGVLRWEFGSGIAPARRSATAGPRRGGQRRERATTGRVVGQFKFADIPGNQVGQKLIDLDAHLTPNQGLFVVTPTVIRALASQRGRSMDSLPAGSLDPRVSPAISSQGRLLLFIHGTFSNCENLLLELASSDAGAKLLEKFGGQGYDHILAFNHPTLSVSPILNAAVLASALRGCRAQIDIICHSRGGLVARWWLEMLDDYRPPAGAPEARGEAIFVGSPLAGTGLAAPHRLKAGLDVLTNVSHSLQVAARATGTLFTIAAPLGHAAAVLFSLFGKATALAAKTPVLDAGVSLVPGLAAQSRVGNNSEIVSLRGAFTSLDSATRDRRFVDHYHVVRSNFETADPGWRFWRHFRKGHLADAAADMVFEGDNDLVVDSVSMGDLADGLGFGAPAHPQVHDFRTTDRVHHCNYFRQPETVSFISGVLGLGG